MGQLETFQTKSVAGTIALGKRLGERLDRGDCVALEGGLGAGKTVLVKGIAAGLGVADCSQVTSPTFVLVHEYEGTIPLYHVDLYRLGPGETDLTDLGADEMLATGVVVIEWAEKARPSLPRGRWQINITITGESSRRFVVTRVG